ncbi:MAG TPA: arginase family protein [Roseiflexaceae bacterium]|nr:arginase family protein [Roseiflexaceae bacterium]
MPTAPFFPPDGIATFARAPLALPGEPPTADVVVLGVPWDGGTGLRGGARHGPKAIREASLRFPLWADQQPAGYWDVATERRMLAGVRVIDLGDVAVARASQERTVAAIEAAARRARASGALLVTLGGDHSIAYPLVRAFDDCPNLGIVQLDAHLDFADEVQGGRISSSSPLRRISQLPFVGPMAAIGLRGLRTDPAAYAAARDRGNALVSRAALRCAGPAAVVQGLPAMEQIYLTLDIDVLDPTLAPGASAPELDGLHYDELAELLRAIARHGRIVGMDVVEVSPPLDPASTTALAAAQAVVEALGAVFEARTKDERPMTEGE